MHEARILADGETSLAAHGQGRGAHLGQVEQGPRGRLAQARRLDRPVDLGADVLEELAGQPFQLADVEHFRGGRAAEGDARE